MPIADLPPSLQSGTVSVADTVEPNLEELLAGIWSGVGSGTQILVVRDLSATLGGTMIADVRYEGLQPDIRRVGATRMGRIREMAPEVSLRDWAKALGVSPQAIRNWSHREPNDRPELETLLRELQSAESRRPDLSRWLKEPISANSDVRPLDLVSAGKWRAFRAAARLVPAGRRKVVTPTTSARAAQRHRERRAVTGPEARLDTTEADPS